MTAKLDSLVAQRVMKMIPCRGGLCNEPCYWTDSDGSVWHHNGIVPFSPSTSIADAWEVVNEMNGPRGFYARSASHPQSGEWMVTFKKCGLRFDSAEKTAPLAICLAALRAVGVTEGEIQEAMQ